MFDITTRDIKYLQGVGPQRATVLNKELNIFSLRDLLYYFPYKYVDRSRLYYIHEIDGNMPYIQLKGEILSFETFGEGRQRLSVISRMERGLLILFGFKESNICWNIIRPGQNT